LSYLADHIEDLLCKIFPLLTIQKEYYVVYKNQRLFVDFYLPSLLIAVEVHGRQHDVFVEHYHKDSKGWIDHQKRDKLKEEWAHLEGITYVVIRESDNINTKEDLMSAIERAQ